MLDRDAYRRGVLDPARARGNTPPADLFVRYGLDGSPPLQGEVFDRHVTAVVAYWRTLKQQKRSYGKLVDALLIGHGELARAGAGRGGLTWGVLDAETRRRADEATGRLTEAVTALSRTTTRVSRAAFDHLVADTGGACSEDEVRRALAGHGVGVVDRPWELPAAAPPAYRTLRAGLGLLGLGLSAEAVVGTATVRAGFRLRDGFRLVTGSDAGPAGPLTQDMVAAAVRRSAGRARDEGKTAGDTVLATLAEAAREPGRLDELLLWELMQVLRPQVDAGMPMGLIAGRAVALGLVVDEAEELALAMLTAGARPAGAVARLEEALHDDRLRAAERLLPGLPADAPPELRAQVEERLRQVAGWAEEAARELAAGRTESAAELLHRAARTAVDDDAIGDRLRALPPPPPGAVRVGVQEDAGAGRVTVAWEPSPARVGPVVYRVVRTAGAAAAGAGAGTVVGETGANELSDPAPPAGADLHYTVLAGRVEGIWSAPAAGPPVTVLPEVHDLAVLPGTREIVVTWRLPPDAAEAVVTRLDPQGGPPPAVDRGGFADTGVTPGRTCRYRVQAVYERPDGTRGLSRGVVVTGLPEEAPQAVPALSAELAGDGGPPVARITWTPPSSGRVVIRTSAEPPPWPSGTGISPDEADRYGRAVPGAAVPGPGGRRTLSTPFGGASRRYYVAVTVGTGRAVVGPAAVLMVVDPVRDLTVRRMGGTVELSWIWPSGAELAEVIWAPAASAASAGRAGFAAPAGPGGDGGGDPAAWAGAAVVECSRRAYEDDGCHVEVGPGAVRLGVRTVMRDGEGATGTKSGAEGRAGGRAGGGAGSGAGELRSRPVVAAVPATATEVRYEFRRPRLPLRRRPSSAVLVLTTERRCRLPPLVVVHRAGGVLPLRPEQGVVIHEIPAGELDPEHPRTLRIAVPAASGGSRLACFPVTGAADADAGAVTLIPLPGTW
ncbi:hypothetical protein [Spirillospora sp. NBC_01491]|uniref:hypothetical protein n=1 Tax=Spirillospora sp. NBC_01491 TaxID=2976007 RepID=UPI002E341FBF|nr:hypothetical protein [Spirillospora sp. NBC_01491]